MGSRPSVDCVTVLYQSNLCENIIQTKGNVFALVPFSDFHTNPLSLLAFSLICTVSITFRIGISPRVDLIKWHIVKTP